MKKIISSLILSFCLYTYVSAQNNSEHLTFKGVPIDGTLTEYVSKMTKAGLELLREHNGTARLQGDFAGYKDCNITVSTLSNMDVVSSIEVTFPYTIANNWKLLESNYDKLKSMLTKKYGQPAEVIEKFDTTFKPKTDEAKVEALSKEKGTWKTTYETSKGSICLFISKASLGSVVLLKLEYKDKVNTEVVQDAAMDDL